MLNPIPGRPSRQLRRLLAGTALIALPTATNAQEASPANPSRLVSINPFVILFGYFSGEYEQRVRPTLSVALAGSSVEFGDDDDFFGGYDRRANVDLKARLYPTEKALQGLGLAAGVGWTQMKREVYTYGNCDPFNRDCFPTECTIGVNCEPTLTTRTFSAPSFSIEFTYQWLLGKQKATAFTVGFGAKRALTSREKWGNYERIMPTGKLNVGYAF